ncbi:MAG: hypothetical protein ACTSXD_04750 [Candidatus Heimdallarchaeaceae archaeon]
MGIGKEAVIIMMLKMLYSSFLRDILVKAVENPDETWDDHLLRICDKLFDFK